VFLLSLTVFEIFKKKTVFEKSLSGARDSKNVLTWVEYDVWNICLNWESRVSVEQWGNIFPKLWVGGVFFRFFEPLYLKNCWRQNCSQRVNYCKLKDLQTWFWSCYWYIQRFLRYFEKTVFEKRLSAARISKNVLTWVELSLFYYFFNWELGVSPGQHSRDNVSQKLRVVYFFRFFEPLSQQWLEISKRTWKY